MEFGQTFISSFRTVYFSLYFGGNSFSTDFRHAFVSDTSQWSRACCMQGILDCWATAWIDCSQALSYRLELTVHKLIFVHESTRFCLCSTKHLWIVSPQPRTPTRRRQSIDVFNHDSTCRNRRHRRESTKEVHGLVVRIAPVSFSTSAIVSALDSDWTIYYLLISNKS